MSNATQGPLFIPGGGGGFNIPAIGIRISTASTNLHPSSVKSAILEAIEHGYRHLQTLVSRHQDEAGTGEAIVEGLERGLVSSREDLFITSKLHNHDHAAIIHDLNLSLKKLHLEYVDLFLIEWAGGADEAEQLPNEVWEAMEECQRLGLTKAIGVCNFSSKMLENILKYAKVPPCVNQVGMKREKELGEFCSANKISIIASGDNARFLPSESEVVDKIVEDGADDLFKGFHVDKTLIIGVYIICRRSWSCASGGYHSNKSLGYGWSFQLISVCLLQL